MKLNVKKSHRYAWPLWFSLSLILLLSACVPMPAPTAPSSAATPAATTGATESMTATAPITGTASMTDAADAPVSLTGIDQALLDAAMALVTVESGATNLTVAAFTAVEWPDSSLGCPQPETMYMQVITPGYQITLTAADGTTYAVHTESQPGGQMVLCPAAP